MRSPFLLPSRIRPPGKSRTRRARPSPRSFATNATASTAATPVAWGSSATTPASCLHPPGKPPRRGGSTSSRRQIRQRRLQRLPASSTPTWIPCVGTWPNASRTTSRTSRAETTERGGSRLCSSKLPPAVARQPRSSTSWPGWGCAPCGSPPAWTSSTTSRNPSNLTGGASKGGTAR